jgi:hypothetical protein
MTEQELDMAELPPLPPLMDHGARAFSAAVAVLAFAALGVGVVALLRVNGWDGQLPRVVVAIARPIPAGVGW